jgi:hypothetical protein
VSRVLILHGTGHQSLDGHVDLAERLVIKVREDLLRNVPGLTADAIVEKEMDDVHDYGGAFQAAYLFLREQLLDRNRVWVNVSSMPRPVSFAWASAAQALALEDMEWQERLTIYYTAPQDYLVTSAWPTLQTQVADLEIALRDGGVERLREAARSARDAISRLADTISNQGMTVGAREVNGSYLVPLPLSPPSRPREFEKELLTLVRKHGGNLETVTRLAHLYSAKKRRPEREFLNIKARVVYTARLLQRRGFFRLEEKGRSTRIELTPLGQAWLQLTAKKERVAQAT